MGLRSWLFDSLVNLRMVFYPALSVFDSRKALKRLQAYEREERETLQPWEIILRTAFLVLMILTLASPSSRIPWATLMLLTVFPLLVIQYVRYRRLRRRVNERVATELRDGRPPTCLECGYDLRAAMDQCPECGAPRESDSMSSGSKS